MRFQTLFFGTDFSETSDHALEIAVSLAREYRARLIVCHVVDQAIDYSFAYTGIFPYQVPLKEYLEDVQEKIAALIDKQIEEKVDATIPTEKLILSGTPYKTLVEAAKEKQADILVLGTHGRTGISHLLIGSTAERVVRHAHCPVLTVRRP